MATQPKAEVEMMPERIVEILEQTLRRVDRMQRKVAAKVAAASPQLTQDEEDALHQPIEDYMVSQLQWLVDHCYTEE
jgi:hypothetical protein